MPSAKSVLASRRGGPSLALNLSQSTLELPAHKLHRQNSSESTLSSDSGLCSSPGTGFLSVALSCHSSCSAPSSPIGPKFKLTRDFDAAVCRLNQHKTLVSKILSSRFLRRWENHSVRLGLHAIDSVEIFVVQQQSVGLSTPSGRIDVHTPTSVAAIDGFMKFNAICRLTTSTSEVLTSQIIITRRLPALLIGGKMATRRSPLLAFLGCFLAAFAVNCRRVAGAQRPSYPDLRAAVLRATRRLRNGRSRSRGFL
ncbi:hypothetical protein BIW11_11638 [Tropilaelaps mercedesae]|uniref:C-Maf-inducing protein PH domain-containing protein n=1 Tax=Tropilaelaps mercedesae TaxID=418985 RepID=A0A1V9XAL6_9ACAR|nr:hypothetical protein BIW11_11638 [Tropilaelaps mercedesae]